MTAPYDLTRLLVPGFEATLLEIIAHPITKRHTRLNAIALLILGVERGAFPKTALKPYEKESVQ